MILNTGSIALAIVTASTAMLLGSNERGVAQDADAIRAKCINTVMNALPNSNPDQSNRAGLELYFSCMKQNGLTP